MQAATVQFNRDLLGYCYYTIARGGQLVTQSPHYTDHRRSSCPKMC